MMQEQVEVEVKEIRLRNFRAFENARLTLSDLTFLVGRNGAGKSSLLDAVELLRDALTGSLTNALDQRGGIHKVRRVTAEGEGELTLGIAVVLRFTLAGGRSLRGVYGFELSGDPADPESHLREGLHLASSEGLALDRSSAGSSFERTDRTFDSRRKTGVSPPPGNLVLPLVAGSDTLWSHTLDTLRNLRSYELSPALMAAAPKIRERTSLDRDGANVGDALKAIEESPAHRWVVERLGAITEGICDIRADALMGRRVLNFIQRKGSDTQELDASQVSQGTLRGLGVLLALRQRPLPPVVLIDEIENSVHPGALAVLLEAALASADGTKVVLTTHSPEVLSHPAVTGERVRVVEWRAGTSQVYRLNAETEAAINEIDTVGWLLSSNALWTGPEPERFGDDLFALDGGEG